MAVSANISNSSSRGAQMNFRVRVYFNLHKKVFSVLHKTPKGWRLWRHLEDICLHNVVFRISESGRQRVIKEKKKNVHAYIEGNLHGNATFEANGDSHSISYNPYKYPKFHFVGKDTYTPITTAKSVRGLAIKNQKPKLIAYL